MGRHRVGLASHTVQAAFVVIVGQEGAPVPPDVRDRLSSPAASATLAFEVGASVSWFDDDATTLVAAWAERVPGVRADWAWSTGERALSVVAGPLRRIGQTWLPPERWADLLRSIARRGCPDGLDTLTGEYAGVVVGTDGRGVAVTDAFANRALYVGHGASFDVVGSNARLVAATMSTNVAAAPLDPLGVCGLAYTKHRIGERTGYESVRSVPIGTFLEIAPHAICPRARAVPWHAGSTLDGADPATLIDAVEAALEEEVVAASKITTERTTVDLTGGKDSRLVLALAMLGGATERFGFRTDGPPAILDVEIASELAALTGVRWTNGVDRTGTAARRRTSGRLDRHGLPWRERMADYVRDTYGICNISDTSGRSYETSVEEGPGRVRVSGLSGELLRSTLTFELPDERALLRRFDRHFGHLDLLRPEWLAWYRTAWIDDVVSGSPSATWNARHDSFLLRTQVRANCGPRLELMPLRSIMPLSSLAAVRAAYALPDTARVEERVHREIIARASPRLAEHRLTKGTWQHARPAPSWAIEPRRRRWRRAPDPRAHRLDRPPTKPAVDARTSLPASNYREALAGHTETVALLRELAADRSNPAWDVIDPAAVVAATERFATLPRAAHVELLGAATAALWLART